MNLENVELEKIHSLVQDNGSVNGNGQKYHVHISDTELVYHLRKFFRWRKNVTFKRLLSTTTSREYDSFIKYLKEEAGY